MPLAAERRATSSLGSPWEVGVSGDLAKAGWELKVGDCESVPAILTGDPIVETLCPEFRRKVDVTGTKELRGEL